jgi:hypothetical protein
MSNDDNFDKIFSEITSRENMGEIPGVKKALSLDSARDYSLFMAELITAIQEINLIIVNLTEVSDDPFEIPDEVIEILESLYSKARQFNDYMIKLDQEDLGFIILMDDDEEDDKDDQ